MNLFSKLTDIDSASLNGTNYFVQTGKTDDANQAQTKRVFSD